MNSKTALLAALILFSHNAIAQTVVGYHASKISQALVSDEFKMYFSSGVSRYMNSIETIKEDGRYDLDNFIISYDEVSPRKILNCSAIINVVRENYDYLVSISDQDCQ